MLINEYLIAFDLIILVVGIGYPVLQLPAVSHLLPQKYKPLTICGT